MKYPRLSPPRRFGFYLGVAVALLGVRSLFSQQTQPVAPAVSFSNLSGPEESSWRFVNRFTARVAYDDNLFIQPVNKQSDTSLHLAPSFGLGIGNFRSELTPLSSVPHLLVQSGEEELSERNFVYLNYSPEGVLYRHFTSENALNHDVRLAAQRQDDLLFLNGSLRYQNITDANIDAGQRLRQVGYTGEAEGAYAITGKSSLGLRLYYTHSDYENALSSTDQRGSAYAQFRASPRTRFNVGYTVGRLDVDAGGDQTYQRPWLEVRYDASDKLSFGGQAGEDFRHFPGMGGRSRLVFAGDGSYRVSPSLTLMASANRDVQSSALFAGENMIFTRYQLGFRQQAFSRNYISVFGGVTRNHYEENQSVLWINRTDDYQFYKVAFARDITAHGSVEIAYDYRNDDSTLARFGFTENVVSAAVSFVF